MAPSPDSLFFPSLEKCLSGEELIISWKSVFSAITSNVKLGNDHRAVIERFLTDPEAGDLLAKPYNAFPEPSPQSKTAFETKTSAINVTPSLVARYDVKQVKSDALWLSKVANIDEMSALRVVIEECQSRAAVQLAGPFSEEELVNIRESAGGSKFSSAIPVAFLSPGQAPEAIQKQFDTEDQRKRRILSTYICERRHLLKCSETLFHACAEDDSDMAKEKLERSAVAASWAEACKIIFYTQLTSEDSSSVLRLIEAIEIIVKNLQKGSGWSEQDGGGLDLEMEWFRAQLTEMTHLMEIIWLFNLYVVETTSSHMILAWFRLLHSCSFFNNLETGDETAQFLCSALQSVSMMISVAIFDLDSSLPGIANLENNVEVSVNVPLEKDFILNQKTLVEIHTIILQAADAILGTAGPAILAWSLLLNQIAVRVEETDLEEELRLERESSQDTELTVAHDPFKAVLDEVRSSTEEDDIIPFLARRALDDCRVFETLAGVSQQFGNTTNAFFSNLIGADMRRSILDLIQRARGFVGYIPESVEAIVSTLTGGNGYWDALDSKQLDGADDPVQQFLLQPELFETFLGSARQRYPLEPLPFLEMLRAVASSPHSYLGDESKSVLQFIDKLDFFTYEFPQNFVDYETTQEEENTNNIRLTRPLQLFESRSRGITNVGQNWSSAVVNIDPDFVIPAGTLGRIISDSGPKIAFWYHEYSGLKYFGKLLETFLAASDVVDNTTQKPAERETVAAIIGFLASLLATLNLSVEKNPNSKETAHSVLKTASSGLNRNRDITAVIFEIFEEELQNISSYSGAEIPLDLLVSCVQFIHAILPFSPGRVWPLLSRSSLLGVRSGSGKLSTIVEGVELLSGRFNLLISCCRLFESLVDDFANNAINRRSRGKSSARFDEGADLGTGISDQTLSQILLTFTRYLVEVFESAYCWRFAAQDDRRRLGHIIATTFNKILRYAYGIESPAVLEEDDEGQTAKRTRFLNPRRQKKEEKRFKIMEPAMQAAGLLLDSFLTVSATSRFQPFLASYFDALDTPDSTVYLNLLWLWTNQVNSILSLSTTLLRVSTMLERPASRLESQLFQSSPLIARLYAVHDTYRNSVVSLFETLIVAASNDTAEPPSLLGNLGPQTAKNFLHVLADLDKPLSRVQNLTVIWHFLSIVVSNRQQWFANYLLSGRTPRDALEKKTDGKELTVLDQPLLTTALETLSGISELSQTESLSILEFVALAQNFWPWTVCNSPKYPAFIKAITEFLGLLKPVQQSTKIEKSIEGCYQTRIAAYIAEIVAMHLFHARQTGADPGITALIPNLSYLTRFAVAVPTYNASLHTQLRRNFEARYNGCSIQDLKRSTLEERQIGKEYFYDLSLADKMLSLSQAWTGLKSDGLRAEFELANVNLSLVDAQIAMFHSWRFLAIELSGHLVAEIELQKTLAKVVGDCLVANEKNQPPEEIFSRLSHIRADFAIVLTQRLIQAQSSVDDVSKLLNIVWNTIRTLRGSFERPVPDGDHAYYRSLLKLLFLAVRIHAEAPPPAQEDFRSSLAMVQHANIIPTVLDILKYVVSIGIRELAANIHDAPADSSPEDLSLITGILQSCLRVQGIELCHSQIVSMMASESTSRVVSTLFSWSDAVAINGDPIYGELSMLFLLELSSMPLMAEQLAIDGILGQIASANITSYLRRPGVSPFAESAGLQRCYNIWAKGILPLLLNLLDAVQSSIAVEVALFLEQFQLLVTQSEQSFDTPATSRIIPKGQSKFITLTMCSEVHSMAMLTFILNGFRESLQGTIDIPEVKWDAAGVLENVEFFLSTKSALRERILPMGEREVEWVRKKQSEGKTISKLEEKIVAEMIGIRDVLSGNNV